MIVTPTINSDSNNPCILRTEVEYIVNYISRNTHSSNNVFEEVFFNELEECHYDENADLYVTVNKYLLGLVLPLLFLSIVVF